MERKENAEELLALSKRVVASLEQHLDTWRPTGITGSGYRPSCKKGGLRGNTLSQDSDLSRQWATLAKILEDPDLSLRAVRDATKSGMFSRYRVVIKITQPRRQQRITLPPGMLLDHATRFLLTRDAHHRYVEPVIADMRVEYCDALAAGNIWHARWIAARVYLLVIPGYLYGCAVRAAKRLFSA
jgi:hypothetical protein